MTVTPPQGALAERLREATQCIRFDNSDLSLTARFGMTIAPPGESMADMPARADKAMYLSKSHNRDCVTRLQQ